MADADRLHALALKLRAIPTLGPKIAAAAAPGVLAAAKVTANAGTTPEGTPWPEKKGGGRALPHAADALSVRVDGDHIVLSLTGPAVYHQKGGRVPERRILPDGGAGIPPHIRKPIADAARAVLSEALP
jgi:hypothetical protein